jgi:hypothetical protein
MRKSGITESLEVWSMGTVVEAVMFVYGVEK